MNVNAVYVPDISTRYKLAVFLGRRRERLPATVLTVSLTTNEFKEGPQYSNALTLKLPIVTDSTPELIRWALQGIRVIYRDGYHYKKAGVMLTGLVSASQTQADLFDARDRGKSKRLMSALDLINARWGAGTLHYGSSGITRGWKTQFQRRSPAYTTDWNGLPLVQT
jgi:DNA polymerase V